MWHLQAKVQLPTNISRYKHRILQLHTLFTDKHRILHLTFTCTNNHRILQLPTTSTDNHHILQLSFFYRQTSSFDTSKLVLNEVGTKRICCLSMSHWGLACLSRQNPMCGRYYRFFSVCHFGSFILRYIRTNFRDATLV